METFVEFFSIFCDEAEIYDEDGNLIGYIDGEEPEEDEEDDW